MTPEDQTLETLALKAASYSDGIQAYREFIDKATPQTILDLLNRLRYAEDTRDRAQAEASCQVMKRRDAEAALRLGDKSIVHGAESARE